MNWQQKAAALNALAELDIKIREPGDWYCSQSVSIREEFVLVGTFGNGDSPEAAVDDHWKVLVEDIGARYLIANDGRYNRKAVRWNGYMWADVSEPHRAPSPTKE